jgi:iron complex transport system permease protein
MFNKKNTTYLVSSILLCLIMLASIQWGAVSITNKQMAEAIQHFFQGKKPSSIYEGVFLQIRLPRVLLCLFSGAILSVSGVFMQGLFRNPLVEPGIIGTSAGAAFGASIVFVLAAYLPIEWKSLVGPLLVPLFAFIGAILATYLVYAVSKSQQKTNVMSILLVGLAINAMGLSGMGFMTYIARDPQARSINFWNLGTFSGANWQQVLIVFTLLIIVIFSIFKFIKPLNALLLGEEEALHLGVNIKQFRRKILLINTIMVAIVTSFVGVIGFVGLIVPHIVRQFVGSDHKKLLPAAMIIGAAVLLLADLLARLLLAPSEIPIGIITSLVGAPIFIFLLKKKLFLKSDA